MSQLFLEKLGSELTKNNQIAKIYGSEASSCRNRQTDESGYFGSFWPVFRQAKIFSKNLAPSVWVVMVPQLHAKYEENLLSHLWEKNTAVIDKKINRTILGLFGPFLHKREFFPKIRLHQFISFEYLRSLKMYNIKKLMIQSWEKCYDKKWTYIWTDPNL